MQRCANKVKHTVLCEAMGLPWFAGVLRPGRRLLGWLQADVNAKDSDISDHRPHPGVIFVGPTCAGEHRYNHGTLEPVEIPDWMPCWPV